MTRGDHFTHELEDFLDKYEGPPSLPEQLRDAVLADIAGTRQSGPHGLRRYPNVKSHLASPVPYGLVAVAVAAVALLGALFFLDGGRGIGRPGPAAEPPPASSPAAPSSRIAHGQEVRWSIEYQNPSSEPLGVYHVEGLESGGAWIEPCMAGGSTGTYTAPFTIHLGSATRTGIDSSARDEVLKMPVILDSDRLQVLPGDVGYRLIFDADGRLSEILPIDELRDPLREELC